MIPLPLLFFLALTLVSAQDPSPSPGLTRDFCQLSTSCQSPRKCYYLRDATLLPPDTECSQFDSCRCVPPSYTHCQASSDCDDDEICARTLLFPFVCTSRVFLDRLPGRVVTIEASRSDPLVPFCAPPSTPVAGAVPKNGLVFDPCLPGTCADALSCVFPRGDGKYQCCADGECVCHAPDVRPMCQYTRDCNRGEVCAFGPTLPQQCYPRRWMRTNQPALLKRLKILRASTPTPDPADSSGSSSTATPAPVDSQGTGGTTDPGESPAPSDDTEAANGEPEEAICVDADALSHLSSDQLVFKQNRLARVLCDVNGSCATPGHIVKFKGTAMMMKSYCFVAGCAERVKRVNSARYRRGFLTSSKTHGLEYTAFAARYVTRAEEGVLAAAVRFGF